MNLQIKRINGFEHAYGTILYFEDEDVIKSLQEQMPSYADNFANWAVQTNAMHQYAIWTALSSKGIGASLQHYNPLVDQVTTQTFDIPASWKLVAQMPFGDILKNKLVKKKFTLLINDLLLKIINLNLSMKHTLQLSYFTLIVMCFITL